MPEAVSTEKPDPECVFVSPHLEEPLERFGHDHPLERTVLVMMKFEGGVPESDAKLRDLYHIVSSELSNYGLNAVRTDEKDYSPSGILFDNVVVYMLGSKYGIAVLEDLYSHDINPNVALEFGYMLALCRRVVLLVSDKFPVCRADWLGRLYKRFGFADPESVRRAVRSWMVDLGINRIKP